MKKFISKFMIITLAFVLALGVFSGVKFNTTKTEMTKSYASEVLSEAEIEAMDKIVIEPIMVNYSTWTYNVYEGADLTMPYEENLTKEELEDLINLRYGGCRLMVKGDYLPETIIVESTSFYFMGDLKPLKIKLNEDHTYYDPNTDSTFTYNEIEIPSHAFCLYNSSMTVVNSNWTVVALSTLGSGGIDFVNSTLNIGTQEARVDYEQNVTMYPSSLSEYHRYWPIRLEDFYEPCDANRGVIINEGEMRFLNGSVVNSAHVKLSNDTTTLEAKPYGAETYLIYNVGLLEIGASGETQANKINIKKIYNDYCNASSSVTMNIYDGAVFNDSSIYVGPNLNKYDRWTTLSLNGNITGIKQIDILGGDQFLMSGELAASYYNGTKIGNSKIVTNDYTGSKININLLGGYRKDFTTLIENCPSNYKDYFTFTGMRINEINEKTEKTPYYTEYDSTNKMLSVKWGGAFGGEYLTIDLVGNLNPQFYDEMAYEYKKTFGYFEYWVESDEGRYTNNGDLMGYLSYATLPNSEVYVEHESWVDQNGETFTSDYYAATRLELHAQYRAVEHSITFTGLEGAVVGDAYTKPSAHYWNEILTLPGKEVFTSIP